jgi:hypothetical protein
MKLKEMVCGYRPMEGHQVTGSLASNQPTIKPHEWHAHRSSNAETEHQRLFSWGLWGRLIPTSCSRHTIHDREGDKQLLQERPGAQWGGGGLHYKGPTSVAPRGHSRPPQSHALCVSPHTGQGLRAACCRRNVQHTNDSTHPCDPY